MTPGGGGALEDIFVNVLLFPMSCWEHFLCSPQLLSAHLSPPSCPQQSSMANSLGRGFYILKREAFIGKKNVSSFYSFLSNRYQGGEERRGCWKLGRSVGRLKLPRIPCPSPLWALGVDVRGQERGVIDKADRKTKGTGGLYLGPVSEEGLSHDPGKAEGSPASWHQSFPFPFLAGKQERNALVL